MLLTAFDTRRPARDIDFAARDLANDIECILDVARAILAVTQKDDDGLVFDPRSAVAEVIRDEEEYSGVRVSMNAELATARVRFHLDVNVGDPVWPAPISIDASAARWTTTGTPGLSVAHGARGEDRGGSGVHRCRRQPRTANRAVVQRRCTTIG
ncbi:MAG: nucleotidyl transferase AbiEii/AbiGii toxin family protein [Kineosporiaceae bacterium]|nr:nucleotidyl transferase AbiEii/AbiGii toxin family protein [Kineosporiaceae bacterium]